MKEILEKISNLESEIENLRDELNALNTDSWRDNEDVVDEFCRREVEILHYRVNDLEARIERERNNGTSY